jgi:hypothetical protein
MEFKLKLIIKLPYLNEWVKGLKIDLNEKLIIAWTESILCFFDSEGKIIRR